MPAAPAGTLAQQVQQQYTYLFRLAQALNRAMEQVEGTAGAQAVQAQRAKDSSREAREERARQAATLKSLIIKSADVVRQEMDRLATELKGSYVAQSDFGTYLEEISQKIEADPSQLSQYFKFASDIRANVDRVEVDFASYKTDVEGYIRQGIVGYDGTVPIIGIAIGQDIRTTQTGVETEQGVFDVIDKSSNMSVWTTEKLSFYIGGQEAAYFSNGKLTGEKMATSGVISTNTKYGSCFWVKWEISGSQNIADNKTTIAWSCGLTPGEQYYTNAIKMSAVSIAGVKVYAGGTYSDITDYKDHTFASGTLALAHDADGTKSFTVAAFSGWLYGNGDYTAAAKSFALPTIPRATTPAIGPVTIGGKATISLPRASASFTHTLSYTFESATGTIATGVGSSCTWTVPERAWRRGSPASSAVPGP